MEIGKKFDYLSGLNTGTTPNGANQGIGGAGLDIFSINPDKGNMNGVDLNPDATNQDYSLANGVA